MFADGGPSSKGMRAVTSYFSTYLLTQTRSEGPIDDHSEDNGVGSSCCQFSSRAIVEERKENGHTI